MTMKVIVALLALLARGEWESNVNEEGRHVQSLQISAPSMTEEDQYGYVMPDRYRCDSCKVVVYHLNEALTKRQLHKRQLRESEYQELFDETCKSAFKGYGITLVNGENALSGPALKQKEVTAGSGSIQMGGETWEKRLGEICRKFVYDKVGEDELYEHFHTTGSISEELCFAQSRDCSREAPRKIGAKPTNKAKQERKQAQTKKATAPQQGEKSSKDKSREAREQKLRADTEARSRAAREQAAKSPVSETRAHELLDVNSFFTKLAVEHNVPEGEYTRKRTAKEWEQVLIRAAGQIFERSVAEKDAVLV